MFCPKCGKETRKGNIEAHSIASLTQVWTQVVWHPEEYDNKLIKKEAVNLRLKADGYYCDECMMVFAAFEER